MLIETIISIVYIYTLYIPFVCLCLLQLDYTLINPFGLKENILNFSQYENRNWSVYTPNNVFFFGIWRNKENSYCHAASQKAKKFSKINEPTVVSFRNVLVHKKDWHFKVLAARKEMRKTWKRKAKKYINYRLNYWCGSVRCANDAVKAIGGEAFSKLIFLPFICFHALFTQH